MLYQNANYTCISWYSKIFWFPVNNCWCQQDSWNLSRDSYIFWIHIREQPQKRPSWIGLKNAAGKMQNLVIDKIAPKINSGIILFTLGLTIYHCCPSCFEVLVLMNNGIKDRSNWLCQRKNCCDDLKLFLYKCAKLKQSFCVSYINCILEKNIYLDLNIINHRFIKRNFLWLFCTVSFSNGIKLLLWSRNSRMATYFSSITLFFFFGMCFGEYLVLLLLLRKNCFFYQDLDKLFERYG